MKKGRPKLSRRCPLCQGRGRKVYDTGTPVYEDTCYRCKGKGWIPAAPWKKKVVNKSKRNCVHVSLSIFRPTGNPAVRDIRISAEQRDGARAYGLGSFGLAPKAARKLAEALIEAADKVDEGYR